MLWMRSPFAIGALLITLALAVFVSPWASSDPDGLEKVAIEQGFDETAEEHALRESPLADYAVQGVDDARLSTAASGVVGVLATFGIAALLFGALRLRRTEAARA